MSVIKSFKKLGLTPSAEITYSQTHKAYKILALAHHPDHGGNEKDFTAIQSADKFFTKDYNFTAVPEYLQEFAKFKLLFVREFNSLSLKLLDSEYSSAGFNMRHAYNQAAVTSIAAYVKSPEKANSTELTLFDNLKIDSAYDLFGDKTPEEIYAEKKTAFIQSKVCAIADSTHFMNCGNAMQNLAGAMEYFHIKGWDHP